MSVDKDCLRAELGSCAQRHGGMDSELAGGVRSCRDDSALVALSANHDWLALQAGIEEFFHGDEEGVHIDVEDGAGKGGLLKSSHVERILSAVLATVRPEESARPAARIGPCPAVRSERQLASHFF